MHAWTPLYPAICLLAALCTVGLLDRASRERLPIDRNAAIDGLRGHLAFFVFMHHAAIWYGVTRPGPWADPPSRLLVHMGQTSVALFFMITAFLFAAKVLRADGRPIDWRGLYVGRLRRLAPLYGVAMAALFAIVGTLSSWRLRVPPHRLAEQVLRWMMFGAGGLPDVNDVLDTYQIVAGVIWSLKFEWAFYLCLPLLARLAGRRPPMAWLLLSALTIGVLVRTKPEPTQLLTFAGGILAALLARSEAFRRFARRPGNGVTVMACVGATVLGLDSAYDPRAIALLSLAFSIVACGNPVFGLLTSRTSRRFGDLAYAIYLLHGIVLFVVFRLIVDPACSASLGPAGHWLVICALTPVVVAVAWLAHRWVERPFMGTGPRPVPEPAMPGPRRA